jgi:hypothetical protein
MDFIVVVEVFGQQGFQAAWQCHTDTGPKSQKKPRTIPVPKWAKKRKPVTPTYRR